MKKGDYVAVARELQTLLDEAGRPGADFADIGRRVRYVDYDTQFPNRIPVSDAKDAVLRCLTPRVRSNVHADAVHKISSCEIAANQYSDWQPDS